MNSRFQGVSDEELESALKALVLEERERVADILEHLAEFDRRALPSTRGRSSLWSYCTLTLGYSEKEAWLRVQACRVASRVSGTYQMLRSGELQLSVLALINSRLTPENASRLVAQAKGKSVRDFERILAGIAPTPDKRDTIRVLAAPPPVIATPAAPLAPLGELPLLATPVASEPTDIRVHFGFTGSAELRHKLDRAKQLLWHKFPHGHLEDIIGAALDDLLDKRDPDRRASPPRKTKLSPEAEEAHRRYIPLWVRADVWKRDDGRCAYTTHDGIRCEERSALEYDHVTPWALGGASDEPDNIRLLCRPHNQLLARETFGETTRRPSA
jgi:hypothetical protein